MSDSCLFLVAVHLLLPDGSNARKLRCFFPLLVRPVRVLLALVHLHLLCAIDRQKIMTQNMAAKGRGSKEGGGRGGFRGQGLQNRTPTRQETHRYRYSYYITLLTEPLPKKVLNDNMLPRNPLSSAPF